MLIAVVNIDIFISFLRCVTLYFCKFTNIWCIQLYNLFCAHLFLFLIVKDRKPANRGIFCEPKLLHSPYFLYTQDDTWIFLWAFILNRFFTLRCACLWFEPALTFSLALLLARTMDSVMDVFADLLTATQPVLWPGFRFCFCSFLEPQKNRLASASASTNIWRIFFQN